MGPSKPRPLIGRAGAFPCLPQDSSLPAGILNPPFANDDNDDDDDDDDTTSSQPRHTKRRDSEYVSEEPSWVLGLGIDLYQGQGCADSMANKTEGMFVVTDLVNHYSALFCIVLSSPCSAIAFFDTEDSQVADALNARTPIFWPMESCPWCKH
ncbi:hypothetical protein NCU08529 [Neurospora crassa OR74A]|uniref:Uncharacterized protein n=1 Tax=Neurospora crassa (strain ATCC 24698 / 74-OR23-1A / CBS 708.71 / DSM 1257 / FGSC 987) TaxID=367110 RepID=Q7SBM1_NEUCR|nr:hypothetical protein NCU08529 [Neurospora crassa OR74A]EAA33775.1 hypothetical protein NCU08529 [Neurospora crassa OR74A]|eukprot:XP_963011.1 hypothetical protein NCU08529 [Neurospora crassa OR74A]